MTDCECPRCSEDAAYARASDMVRTVIDGLWNTVPAAVLLETLADAMVEVAACADMTHDDVVKATSVAIAEAKAVEAAIAAHEAN